MNRGLTIDMSGKKYGRRQMTYVDFHNHLDRCQQCRDNPFNLCGVGYFILRQVAATPFKKTLEVVEELERTRTDED